MFERLKEKIRSWIGESSKEATDKTEEQQESEENQKKTETNLKIKEERRKPRKKRAVGDIEKEREVSKRVLEDIKEEGIRIKSPEEKFEDAEKEKQGIFSRLFRKKEEKVEEEAKLEIKEEEQKPEEKKGFLQKVISKFKFKVTEEYFNSIFSELELVLLENNVAFEVVEHLKASLKKELIGKEIAKDKLEEEIKNVLKLSINELLKEPFDLFERIKEKDEPFVIVFFGINGSGKCIGGDSEVQLSNGNVIKIRDLYELVESYKKPIKDRKNYIIKNPGIELPSLNPGTLKIENKRVSAIWKLKSPKYLYKIILDNGQEIITTPEHPFFTIKEGKIKQIRSDQLIIREPLAISKRLPIQIDNPKEINILSKLNKSFFVNVKDTSLFYDHLKKEYGSLQKAYSSLNIKQSFNTFAYFWRSNNLIPIDLFLKFKDIMELKSIQYSGSKPIPLIKFSEELTELVGLIIAEGHLDGGVLELTNKDPLIINRFEFLMKSLFSITPKKFIDGRGLIRSRVHQWSVIYFLNSVFNIPFGKKATIVRVPELIFKADNPKIISFLRSYLEAEGYISKDNRTIEIATSSYDIAQGLYHLFMRLGIITTLSKKTYKGFTSYRVYITGYSKIDLILKFGLYTKKNLSKLDNLRSYNHQFELTELVPNTGLLIKQLREQQSCYQSDLAKKINSTQSLISQYELGVSIPRSNLSLFAEKFKSAYLKLLASSDISWIKIKSIQKIKLKEKYVYDLTVDGNHTFIANGIVVHNTTSIAKLASLLKSKGISAVLSASDTFRAASIEQLSQHAEKLGVKVVKNQYNADPASVAFDAIKYARAHDIKVVLIDTAGRMHTKDSLIKEMEKIVRVTNPDLKIFIAESITGNDAIEQAQVFNKSIGIDAIVLSKADVDEKGGTILSVSYVTGKPILYLGTGQGLSDLQKFNKEDILKKIGL